MLFQGLPGVSVCRFKKGEYLMRRGEAMPYVYYLKKGEVKREVLSPYGSEMINTVKFGGQITASIIGLLTIYDSGFDGTCSDDFIAVTDCVCLRVPVEVCMQYLGEHPELLADALKREGVVERRAEGWLVCDCAALEEYLDGTRKIKYD